MERLCDLFFLTKRNSLLQVNCFTFCVSFDLCEIISLFCFSLFILFNLCVSEEVKLNLKFDVWFCQES